MFGSRLLGMVVGDGDGSGNVVGKVGGRVWLLEGQCRW